MKHQTINLVKFKALSKRLGLPLCWTVGLLESLWLFSCHNARDGKLERFTPLELAGWIDYPGDENEMITALIETGWLDRDGNGYLSVHGWDEHKPNWLKGVEKQEKKPQPRSKPSVEPSSRPGLEPSIEPTVEPPNPPLPNLTQPNPPPPCSWAGVEDVLLGHGVAKAGHALGIVQAAGCTVTQVQNLIEHWRARIPAWGPGALYERLLTFKPGQQLDSLWPTPSKQAQSEKAQQETIDQTNKLRADRAESEKLKTEATASLVDLERKYGKKLDAMSDGDRRALCEANCCAFMRFFNGEGPVTSPLLRAELLRTLKRLEPA